MTTTATTRWSRYDGSGHLVFYHFRSNRLLPFGLIWLPCCQIIRSDSDSNGLVFEKLKTKERDLYFPLISCSINKRHRIRLSVWLPNRFGKKAIDPKSIWQLDSTTHSTARSFELAITFESCTYLTLQQIELLQFHPVCHFCCSTTPPLEHSSKRDLRNHSTGHPMSGRLMQLVTG